MRFTCFLLSALAVLILDAFCADQDALDWHYEKVKEECHDLSCIRE